MRMTAVIPTRRDGYGGNSPDRRFIFSVESFLHYFDEVVIVDWNSPDGLTMLESTKNLISNTGRIREVVVSEQDLINLRSPQDTPFPTSIASNIGLRRASNDWVLSSTANTCPIGWPPMPKDGSKMYVSPRCGTWAYKIYSVYEANEFLSYLMFNQSQLKGCESESDFLLAHKNLWYAMGGHDECFLSREGNRDRTVNKARFYAGGVEVMDSVVAHTNHFPDKEFREPLPEIVLPNTNEWGYPDYEFKIRTW